jgi:hypothetical protein
MFLFGIYFVDAMVVLGGLSEALNSEAQVCVVLFFSVLRTGFFALCSPAQGRKENNMHLLNSAADTFQVLLLYSMIGKDRASSWNGTCTLIIAISQILVILVNMFMSFFELIEKFVKFTLYILRMLSQKQRAQQNPDDDEPEDMVAKLVQTMHPLKQILAASLLKPRPQAVAARSSFKQPVRSDNPLAVAFSKAAADVRRGSVVRSAMERRATTVLHRQSEDRTGGPLSPFNSLASSRHLLPALVVHRHNLANVDTFQPVSLASQPLPPSHSPAHIDGSSQQQVFPPPTTD